MTRIGTPLSSSATRVMLLGAGELGKEVIIALQRLGVEVIAVDRYANAPGQQVAHRAHVISMTDSAALRALVEREKPDLIVPEIEAIATDELARIESEGLARVIVEAVVEFDFEITLLTVRARDASGGVVTHFCEPVGHRQVKGDYVESWQPQPMSEAALTRAREMAGAVTGALGGQGIFGVEFFVRGDEVWFSEVSPRPHDTGLVTLATQWQSEFELHARAILGLPVDTRLRNPGASAVIYGGIEATGVAYEGVDQALAVPGTDLRLFGKPEAFERRRMGVVVAYGDNIDDCRARARKAAGRVRVVAG
jgi:formate-dependent phosphoribosylglycinamide formyltransferase (GAR transformylase)